MVETRKHAVKRGKKSRAQGGIFETRVRADLEEKRWIVDKWTNQVEFESEVIEEPIAMCELKEPWNTEGRTIGIRTGKLVSAKPKYLFINGSMKMVGNSSGFPDFLCMRKLNGKGKHYEVIGIEAKMNGELDKAEKEKCVWLLNKGIFSKILIASKHKIKNRVHIEYKDFKEKYFRFYK